MEQWKDIPGFPGYQASNLGAVVDCDGKILRQYNTAGYLRVKLICAEGKLTTRSVNALVLMAFIGPRPTHDDNGKPRRFDALHWDGDSVNNRLENLRWGTPVENSNDLKRHRKEEAESGIPRKRQPSRCKCPGFGKLIKTLREQEGLSQSQLAKECQIPLRTLQRWEQEISSPVSQEFVDVCKELQLGFDYFECLTFSA